MLKNILVISAILFVHTLIAQKSIYDISPEKSQVKWTGKKIGGEHWGYVPVDTGFVNVLNGRITGGQITIDMKNLSVEDIEDEESNLKLTDHLRSDDFFAVDKYDKAYFRINKALINAFAGDNDPNYTLSGDLTIKGITRKITFPAIVKIGDEKLKLTSNFVFDRSKYEIKYGSKTFFDDLGDKLIHNDVSLDINIVANKMDIDESEIAEEAMQSQDTSNVNDAEMPENQEKATDPGSVNTPNNPNQLNQPTSPNDPKMIKEPMKIKRNNKTFDRKTQKAKEDTVPDEKKK